MLAEPGHGGERRLREFVTHGITVGQRELIGDPPCGHGLLGLIIDHPEPLRLDRIDRHPGSYGFPAHHPKMESFLGVPVRIRNRVFGNLYLADRRGGGSFTSDDEQVLVALAAAAGVVIENARLYEEASRRQRWLEAAAEITAALLGDVNRWVMSTASGHFSWLPTGRAKWRVPTSQQCCCEGRRPATCWSV